MLNIILSVLLLILLARDIFVLIKKYKDGTYNPLIIDLETQGKIKKSDFINYLAIICITYYFVIIQYNPGGIILLIGLISFIVTINILNILCYKQTKINKIVIQTSILDAIFITILYAWSENIIKYLKTIII